MTCRELADFIIDYLAGQLPAEAHAAFEEHLSLCPNCVRYLKTYKATVELGRRAFEDDDSDASLHVPDELVRAILDSRKH